MIEIMDRGIGKVLQCLKEHGQDQNTIVLFTSDNGPAFFNPPYMLETGESTYNERFNCGFKGAKGTALAPFSTQLNLYNLFDSDAPGYDEFGESGGGFYLTPPRAIYLTVRADL